MIKKELIFFILLVSFLFTIPFIYSADNSSLSDSAKVEDAYSCLEKKVEGKCSDLSTEEKIFSLLAISECQEELLDDSDNEECWPDSNCNSKTTAQAILALDKKDYDTKDAIAWLLSEQIKPTNLVWYLEIDSSEPTNCIISYDSREYEIEIDEDRKIDSDAGSCFSLSQDDYWLEVSEDCYNEEFTISCDEDFLTTLLYKNEESDSSTIFVSENVNTAVADGKTTEQINSYCFKKEGSSSCDYEATLWAALVLNYKGEDVDPYIPYLVTISKENEEYFPDAFLYLLTDSTDYQVNLISKQISGYWEVSENKFYDTSIALLALKDESTDAEDDAKSWLLEVQDDDGCWKGGNVRDSAFILYSAWPKTTETETSCQKKGYYCMSSTKCENLEGTELDYSCSGTSICCDKEEEIETCEEQGGIICDSGEECSGDSLDASDLGAGEDCCFEGKCNKATIPKESECEKNDGTCKSSCLSDEESKNYECEDSTNNCCVEKSSSNKKSIFSYWWVWALIILIIILILLIIFKDKLRTLLFRIKSSSGNSRGAPSQGFGPGPRFPPSSPLQQRIIPRRIISSSSQATRRPIPKKDDDFSDILKKLKDIGS